MRQHVSVHLHLCASVSTNATICSNTHVQLG